MPLSMALTRSSCDHGTEQNGSAPWDTYGTDTISTQSEAAGSARRPPPWQHGLGRGYPLEQASLILGVHRGPFRVLEHLLHDGNALVVAQRRQYGLR